LSGSLEGKRGAGKQVLKNMISNFIYFFSNLIIGIFLVPFYIKSLGIENYALIPLITSIILYVTFITQSLNSSVLRFLTLDMQRNDFRKANKTFNTSFFGLLGVIALLTPFTIALIYYFPFFFEVPSDQIYEVTILLIGILITFFIKTLGSVFGVSLFAYNRLDLQKYIDLFNLLCRVGLTVVFFKLLHPNLIFVSLAYVIGSLIYLIGTVYFSKRISPFFSVDLKDFEYTQFKDITKMSTWLLVVELGTLLFTQAELILVNILFGTVAGGEYAIVLIWSSMTMNMSGIFAGVFAPVIYAHYAKGQFARVVSTVSLVIKMIGISMAPIIGCIFVFAPQLLSIWLGPEYARLTLLMRIIIIHLILNLSTQPLSAVNAAYNKAKIPGVVTLFLGILNILLAMYLSIYTSLGYYGIAISGAIFLTIKNSLFVPWYACKLMGITLKTLAKPMLQGPVLIIPVLIVASMLNHYFVLSTFIHIILVCVIISILYMIGIWYYALTVSEKGMINSVLSSRLHKSKVL